MSHTFSLAIPRRVGLFTVIITTLFINTSAQPLPIDPAIRTGRLDNGLSYYIMYNDQTPGQADFYIAHQVGSILEEPQQRGLAHFLEHLAFNGSEHFPGGNGDENSVRGWCERNGIKFGADLNAYTSIDETVYNIANAPVEKEGVADTCLMILADWAGGLLLKDDEINAERGVIREEWRARRSRFATTRMMEEAMPVIYEGSKYADCLPIGHIEVIDTFAPAELRAFYDKWYRPDLQGVIVVGDVDIDKTEAKIKSLFGQLENPAGREQRIYYPVPDNDKMIVYTRADEEQPTLNLSLYMKRPAEPRENRGSREAFIEGYKSRLAMFILRQRLASLGQEAEPRIMSASVRDNSFYVTPEKDAFAVTIGLLPDNPQAGISAVVEVLEKARRFGFTEAELEHAKIQHAVNIEHKVDAKDKTRNGEYVNNILKHFLRREPCMNIVDEAELQAELADSLTLADINQAVKGIITNTNEVLIVFGPTEYNGQSYTMPSGNQFEQWIAEAREAMYEDDNKNEAVDTKFIKEMPEKGSILSKKMAENGYTEYLLSNGITASVRPSGLEPNRLTIEMFRKGGRSLYPDEDAPSLQLLNTVIRESGASDFDYLTLEKKRRGKALRVVPYIDSEDEGVRGVCAASDLRTWLEVMHLYVTSPRRDEAIFSNIINKQRSLLKNRDANPNVAFNDSLRVAVYGDCPRLQPMTVERLDDVDLDRIYEIYTQRFSDLGGMNLIITGDVREDEIEELLCQYVASMPGSADSSTNLAEGPYAPDIRKGKHAIQFCHPMKTRSALANIIYSSPIEYSAENDLKMDVLAQIMRAVFTEKVREEKGATYGVSVSGQIWKRPAEGGSLTVNFRCAPEMLDELLPIIDEQLKLMATNGPSSEQLDRVKEYERKNYDRAVLTNGWWEYVRYNQLRNGVDFNENYLRKVDSLTPKDIRDFCNQLISTDNRIEVSMLPVK